MVAIYHNLLSACLSANIATSQLYNICASAADMQICRIAGNFQGLYIQRIAIKFIFAETNFVDCMIKATPSQVLLQLVGCEVYDSRCRNVNVLPLLFQPLA